MLSTRNVRLVASILTIFIIVVFFATSHKSLDKSIQNVKPTPNANTIPVYDESKNTLQGNSPHKAGTEAPYSQSGNKQDSTKDQTNTNSNANANVNDNDNEITDDSTSNIKGSSSDSKAPADDAVKPQVIKPPQNIKPGSSQEKPKIMADKIDGVPSTEDQSLSNNNDNLKSDSGKSKKPSTECNDVDYVIMVDAGSTGSRVHIYEFNTCQSPPILLNEKFEQIKPGLSSYDTDTKGAAESLDSLLKTALNTIPKEKQGCTPIAVKATAGLRLLGKEKSDNILNEIRNHLENDWPFAVVGGNGIEIMDGKDEAINAWITANYLLGNIGGDERLPTAAVFDLGGGSTQIVFEPEFNNNEKMLDGEHKYEFTFGDQKFTLYQFSHLGFGLMQGRNKINSLVVKSALSKDEALKNGKITNKKDAKDAKASITITNPCIPPGVTAENIQVDVSDDEIYVVNFKGPSVASGAQCRFLAEQVLNKEAECTSKPCSFNGVHQPSLTKTFKKSNDMYVFSYFYDRTNPLGFPSSFTVEELNDLAKVVCNGDSLWKDVLLDDHVKELNEEPQWCLDLSFITAMLHTGYDIPLYRELRTAKTIDNNELGWCLGASLPLLDKTNGNWKCKVEQVN